MNTNKTEIKKIPNTGIGFTPKNSESLPLAYCETWSIVAHHIDDLYDQYIEIFHPADNIAYIPISAIRFRMGYSSTNRTYKDRFEEQLDNAQTELMERQRNVVSSTKGKLDDKIIVYERVALADTYNNKYLAIRCTDTGRSIKYSSIGRCNNPDFVKIGMRQNESYILYSYVMENINRGLFYWTITVDELKRLFKAVKILPKNIKKKDAKPEDYISADKLLPGVFNRNVILKAYKDLKNHRGFDIFEYNTLKGPGDSSNNNIVGFEFTVDEEKYKAFLKRAMDEANKQVLTLASEQEESVIKSLMHDSLKKYSEGLSITSEDMTNQRIAEQSGDVSMIAEKKNVEDKFEKADKKSDASVNKETESNLEKAMNSSLMSVSSDKEDSGIMEKLKKYPEDIREYVECCEAYDGFNANDYRDVFLPELLRVEDKDQKKQILRKKFKAFKAKISVGPLDSEIGYFKACIANEVKRFKSQNS